MLKTWMEKFSRLAVSLRFSILSIFVTFFIAAMLSLIIFSYYRFTDSMTAIAFHLMKEGSRSAFRQIESELRNAELKCASAAHLLTNNIIDSTQLDQIYDYNAKFMANESMVFSAIESVFWGSPDGSFVKVEKEDDGSIQSDVLDKSSSLPVRKIVTMDATGKVLSTTPLSDDGYDPRSRPWYQAAAHAHDATWLDPYPDKKTKHESISVAAPVYDAKNIHLLGVIAFNLRLDYLRTLMKDIKISKHSLSYLVSTSGIVFAYPGYEKYANSDNQGVLSIDKLTDAPWVALSFQQYQKSDQTEFAYNYQDNRYLATYQNITKIGPSNWLIGTVTPMDDFVGSIRKTQLITLVISLLILIFGVSIVSGLVSAVVKPLKRITEEIDRIKRFNLNDSEEVTSRIKEVSLIADALFSMKKGLRSFQKYVPSTLVRQLIESGEVARVGGVKKPIAILFTDIANFTTITEEENPETLTKHVCEYFDELSSIILSHRGTIDKYIGDAIMTFWGAPLPETQPALQAANAAIHCVRRLRELNARWTMEGKPGLYTRIGIHMGEAIVGNLGASERLNYTAIGDAINIASRLEGINKIYGTQIVISDTIHAEIKQFFPTRLLDQVRLKGKSEPRYIYELLADQIDSLEFDLTTYNHTFEKGYAAYQVKNFDEAVTYFMECLRIYPQDTVAPVFINRCTKIEPKTLKENWNGVWTFDEK